MKAWYNGRIVDDTLVAIPVATHCVGRGSAVFEVLDLIATPQGSALFRATSHVNRLFGGAESMRMTLPYTKEELLTGIAQLARASGLESGVIKIVAFYSSTELSLLPNDTSTSVAVFCTPFVETIGKTFKQCLEPVTAGVSRFLKIAPQSFDVHAKVAGHYVNAFHAMHEVKAKGYAQPVLVDLNGKVTEGALCNLFMVKEGTLISCTPESILLGITRDSVIEIASDLGINSVEKYYSVAELLDADEAFFTGSCIRVQPISAIDGKVLADGQTGPVTKRIQGVLEQVYAGEETKFSSWIERL
jgi:branched-chain amino acid aminotransferase